MGEGDRPAAGRAVMSSSGPAPTCRPGGRPAAPDRRTPAGGFAWTLRPPWVPPWWRTRCAGQRRIADHVSPCCEVEDRKLEVPRLRNIRPPRQLGPLHPAVNRPVNADSAHRNTRAACQSDRPPAPSPLPLLRQNSLNRVHRALLVDQSARCAAHTHRAHHSPVHTDRRAAGQHQESRDVSQGGIGG